MADDAAPETPAPLELLHVDDAGYCDLLTGACELPGAAPMPRTAGAPPDERHMPESRASGPRQPLDPAGAATDQPRPRETRGRWAS